MIVVDSTDDGAMTEVVRAAAGLARPGDTVLLAPAAASYDMFSRLRRARRRVRRAAAAGAARRASVSAALDQLRLRTASRLRRALGRAAVHREALRLACSCCCSPRPGCSCFGVLMAVSTTIAAAHERQRTEPMWRQSIKEFEFIAVGLLLFWFAVRLLAARVPAAGLPDARAQR